MPDSLRSIGPGGLAWWQWIALPVAVVASYLLGAAFARVVHWMVRGLAGRTRTTLDDELLDKLFAPLRLLCAIALLRAAIAAIDLHGDANDLAVDVLLAALAVVLVWAALRAIDVIASRLSSASWAVARPSSRALMSLLSRAAKIVVVVFAGIGFLSSLGLPVSSLIAGLGIGGLALAFGAQKTLENLFGAIALGVDQPLREGDFVKVDSDVSGTVEVVGLRSTRIRTADRTIVTLPNGRLADMKIETFAPRDRIRFATTLGLVYETTSAQLREILAAIERVLKAHPKAWPADVVVRFLGFGQSSLDVEVVAWFATRDYGEFRAYREEILLAIMEIVEGAGSSFAFPTQTVHVVESAQRSAERRS